MKRQYAYKKKLLLSAAACFDFFGDIIFRASLDPKRWGQKILVVRLDQLGDIIQTLPFFDALREAAPAAEIHFLTSSIGSQLNDITKSADHTFVWNCPWFDKNRQPNLSPAQVRKWVQSQNFDTVFELRGDIRLILLLKWAGVKNLIGYGATGGGFLLDQEIPWYADQHAVDKNLALLGQAPRAHVVSPEIPVSSVPASTKKIAIHPDAGTNAKKWPITNFISTVQTLLNHRREVVLIGLDHALGEKIAQPFSGRVKNMMGKTNLKELVDLLSQCDALLTNDSGPAHVMAALNKPVGIVWAGTAAPAIWAPRGSQIKIFTHAVPCAPCASAECFVKGHPCLSNIQAADVAQWVLNS